MNTRFYVRGSVLTAGVFLCLMLGCQMKKSVRSVVSTDNLNEAAKRTFTNYGKAIKAGKERRQENIPLGYWAEPIRELKPIKVYTHRANVVVVQRIQNGREEGKYIYNPIIYYRSSYLPMTGDDGFVLTPDPLTEKLYSYGNGVWDFRRTMPH